jgi:hypothetical protein
LTDLFSFTFGAGLTAFPSGVMSDPNLLAFVFAVAKRLDNPAPGTLFSSFDLNCCSRIALGRRTCAGFVGKGVEEKTCAVSSSGLSCRRRSDGLLVCDWVRSASGAAFEEACRDDLLGDEDGELIVVIARPSTSLAKTCHPSRYAISYVDFFSE